MSIFKRIHCQCNKYGDSWKIPRRRFRFFERYNDIPKGECYVWGCDECFQGVVVPEYYINIYGKKIALDPKTLPKKIKVIPL